MYMKRRLLDLIIFLNVIDDVNEVDWLIGWSTEMSYALFFKGQQRCVCVCRV